jgi:very-short-patch-repair endonuclease
VKFRRQHPVGPYVVDFVSLEAHLVIEIDGSQHLERRVMARDRERTFYLEGAGFHVLRFNNRQVLTELDAVLEAIWEATKGYNPSP